jgi:hypothetical protein
VGRDVAQRGHDALPHLLHFWDGKVHNVNINYGFRIRYWGDTCSAVRKFTRKSFLISKRASGPSEVAHSNSELFTHSWF